MKRLLEIVRFCWFAPTLLVVALSVSPVQAASREETALWNELRRLAGEDADSKIAWEVVTNKSEFFLKRFANSEHVPDVLAIEAQALFKQKNYDLVIGKFSPPPPGATNVADRLIYWTARAWFEKKNYRSAAENFAHLSRDYTNSNLRLEAIYREGEAHAKLEEWPRVIEELAEPDGAFQKAAHAHPNDEWVVSGLLLLSEAQLSRRNFDDAKKTLSAIAPQTSHPDLEWERQFFLCRVLLASGAAKEALAGTTNLLAAVAGKPEWKARSFVLKGQIYETLDQMDEAVRTYETNVNSDLPAEWRRESLLRIVELTLRQNKTEEAAQKLVDYLNKLPAERESDFEWLMLGELRLKQDYLGMQNTNAPGQGTNLLQQAEENFTRIKTLTNSEYLGKAELDLGWCYAREGKVLESMGAFSNAVEHLPFSEDQAVARFKLADAYYARTNFPAAISNYTTLIDQYGSLPAVKNGLFEQVLYQIVRAGLAENNLEVATNAMAKILAWFPDGLLADRSMLLVGQAQGPAEARKVFSEMASRSPQSPLLPEMKLAVARTYEKERDWVNSLARYSDWAATHTNHTALPRAEFSRAWATYQMGNESNAMALFTDFIPRFQSNDLAIKLDLPARAQYWIGDYYWRQGEYVKAEIKYETVHNWSNSPLALPAIMMAGKSALASQRPEKATNYFSTLISDPNCGPELRAQALFALGDALWQLRPASDSSAMDIFYFIATDRQFTNTAIVALAWSRLGNFYYALAGDDAALGVTNSDSRRLALDKYKKAGEYFQQATNAAQADASARGMAEFCLGQTLAAMAPLQPTATRKELQQQALGHFVSVLNGDYLRGNEEADLLSIKLAGLEAAKLAGDLGEWKQAKLFYQRLQKMIPSLQRIIEKKIESLEARENLASGK